MPKMSTDATEYKKKRTEKFHTGDFQSWISWYESLIYSDTLKRGIVERKSACSIQPLDIVHRWNSLHVFSSSILSSNGWFKQRAHFVCQTKKIVTVFHSQNDSNSQLSRSNIYQWNMKSLSLNGSPLASIYLPIFCVYLRFYFFSVIFLLQIVSSTFPNVIALCEYIYIATLKSVALFCLNPKIIFILFCVLFCVFLAAVFFLWIFVMVR